MNGNHAESLRRELFSRQQRRRDARELAKEIAGGRLIGEQPKAQAVGMRIGVTEAMVGGEKGKVVVLQFSAHINDLLLTADQARGLAQALLAQADLTLTAEGHEDEITKAGD